MFSLRNALIVLLALAVTGLGVRIASGALTHVTAVVTIDEKDPAGFSNPIDDDCPVGAACKAKSALNVTDVDKPAASITSISPVAFTGAPGTSIPNGTLVGSTQVTAYWSISGSCSLPLKPQMSATQYFLDGVIMGEVTPGDDSQEALGMTNVWPTRLESDLRVFQLLDSGHPVLRRSVSVLVFDLPSPIPDLQVPVNLLSFDVSDGVGFGDPPLTLPGIYNVAVVGDPETEPTGAMCTPMTSTGLLLGQTDTGRTLQACRAPGTHTMATVLTREVSHALVFDATVSDTIVCFTPVGGVAEYPDVAEPAGKSTSLPSSVLAGAAAAGAVLLVGGAWYARRRWVR